MNRIKSLVKDANFSSRAFPTGTEYASWETDEVGVGSITDRQTDRQTDRLTDIKINIHKYIEIIK